MDIHWNKAISYLSQQENYCRTPTGDRYNDNGPWCYFDTEGGRGSCNVPICDSASCPDLSLRAHLQTQDNKDSYRYGETVNLACETGYKLNGLRNLSCQESGNWRNTIPTCEVVTCHGFSNELHQKWHPVKQSYIYNDNVTFTCDEGYALASSTSITCHSDGTWSDIQPNCTGIPCSPLPKIDKALLPNQTKDYRYPETVKVTCETGYTVEGYDLLECNSTRFWSSVPQCTSIDKLQSKKDSVEIRRICMSYGLFGGILAAIVTISAGVYIGTCFCYRKRLRKHVTVYEDMQLNTVERQNSRNEETYTELT
ncbi:P-selectin-like [Mytilus californianus]|uniref:P-selectin-like n=1 Tax=Mytilus californianus TaxID=6549 RepID=UPI002246DD7B|nr:P-selectin-like [Mytilus californianus]